MHDWDMMTNIPGVFVAGDQIFASDCAGAACATGYYAGRKASAFAGKQEKLLSCSPEEARTEKERLLAPLYADREDGISWKELNMAISKAMQNYCGGVRCEALLREGLDLLDQFERDMVPRLTASNPHELMRVHEVLDILTVSRIVPIRQSGEKMQQRTPVFPKKRLSADGSAPVAQTYCALPGKWTESWSADVPLDYFGSLKEEYEKAQPGLFIRRGGTDP